MRLNSTVAVSPPTSRSARCACYDILHMRGTSGPWAATRPRHANRHGSVKVLSEPSVASRATAPFHTPPVSPTSPPQPAARAGVTDRSPPLHIAVEPLGRGQPHAHVTPTVMEASRSCPSLPWLRGRQRRSTRRRCRPTNPYTSTTTAIARKPKLFAPLPPVARPPITRHSPTTQTNRADQASAPSSRTASRPQPPPNHHKTHKTHNARTANDHVTRPQPRVKDQPAQPPQP